MVIYSLTSVLLIIEHHLRNISFQNILAKHHYPRADPLTRDCMVCQEGRGGWTEREGECLEPASQDQKASPSQYRADVGFG